MGQFFLAPRPFGLGPIKKLANQYGVSTPVIDAVITLSSMVNQTNYLEGSISVKELGISGITRNELN